MIDDLLSLRVLVTSPSQSGQDLLREAASASKVPIEIVEADGATSAGHSIATGVDVFF